MVFSTLTAFLAILIAGVYYLITAYLHNFVLINQTFSSDNPFQYKLKLFVAVFLGMTSTLSLWGFCLFILTGILIGLNLAMVFQKVHSLRKMGKVHLMAGGGTVLSIVGGGCASCGLPVLSLLGISSSMLPLPLHGFALSYISVLLLIISLFFLLKSNKKTLEVCSVYEKPVHKK